MAKKAPRLRLVDTTFRDAQQSLLGGHLRGDEIVPIAAKMDAIGFTAMEAFGGATFETQVRRRENPWEYLRKLDKVTPNTPIQALIRGQNLLANRNFADDVVELFIKHAAKCGVDVFRVFDPLNDLRNMEATVGAALKAKKKVQGALSYAISPAHNIELWCSLAKGLVNMGCHEVVIKDTSGLLSPQATWELVTALKETVNVPIDVHSHCSSGMAPMAYMAAVEAGARDPRRRDVAARVGHVAAGGRERGRGAEGRRVRHRPRPRRRCGTSSTTSRCSSASTSTT